MICDVVSTKEVLTRSLKRAEKLRETMAKTKEGELLDNTIEVAKRALNLLSDRDFDSLRELAKEELVSDIASITLMEKLGGELEASVGVNPNKNSTKQKFTFKSAKYVKDKEHGDMLEIKVTSGKDGSNWGTYRFKKGYSRSQPSSETGVVMLSRELGHLIESTIDTVNGVNAELNRSKYAKAANAGVANLRKILESSDDVSEVLGNAESFSEKDFDYTRASKKGNYAHGNVSHMRNVLADLHAIGGKPISDEQYDYYDNLLSGMHEHFFRDMKLFVDDSAEESQGWVDIDRKHVMINATSNTDSGMSNAEVYTHEVVHTMTAWALNSKSKEASNLKSRLSYLRDKAIRSITWKDLMNADDNLSVKGAKARHEYIFNSKNADHEFVAFALTNPSFGKLLKKVKVKDEREGGLFNSIKDFFSDMINAVMGNYKFSNRNSDVMSELSTLTAALAEINQKADVEIETKSNIFTQVQDIIAENESILEEWVNSITSKLDTKGKVPDRKDMGHIQTILFFAKFFTKSIYNSDYRHAAGKFFTMNKLPAQSSFREIARSVLPGVHDHITIGAEFLGLQMSNVDRARNSRVANTEQSILDNFSKTLVQEEEESLTKILLDANAYTLFSQDKNNGKGYSTTSIRKLLTDKPYRTRAINVLKRRIQKQDKVRGNWIIGQAQGLGIYMATGKGHKAQNSNSNNIVRGYLSNTRHEENPVLLAMVEELASLTAIDNESNIHALNVSNLLKSEEKGVKNVVNLYGAFVKESKNLLFKGDASHIIEGYSKELFDDKIETAYAVISKQEEMESQGFKLKSTFESNDNSGAEAIGFFVSDTYTRPERLSGAVALGNPNSRGMTLKAARYAQFKDSKKHAEVWFEADKAAHDAAAVKINKQLSDGVPLSEIEEGPIPILDASGNAVDYRNMMPKEYKAKFLKQNLKITDVLSKTVGSVVYKDARAAHNEKVTEYIKGQIEKLYDNPSSVDNLLEHTLVGPNNVNPEIRKLYYQLPKSLHKLAASRADNSLPIPDMLMDMYFGYSHLRATDAPGIKHLPNAIKRILNMVEQVFMDIVKIAKGNILLKMPAVLAVNVVSNILFAVSAGTNPFELIGDYTRSIKDVHRFMQRHKKLESEQVELSALKQSFYSTKFSTEQELSDYNDKVKFLSDSIKRLELEMSDNPVKELFDLGMYQAVIEDVNMYKLGETNSVADAFDTINNKFPAVIKTPLNWMFLNKETSWYKANQYVLQMSDLVARDVMNRKHKSIELRQAKGQLSLPYEYRKETDRLDKSKRREVLGEVETERFLEWSKQNRHKNLLRYFINYNLPNGRGEEYLNRIGVLMFTKYVKRIQRVISETGTKHPINTAITLLAAGFALDLEMIQDQSVFVKGGDDYGIYGLTSIHSPDEVLMTVVNPPLINLYEELLGAR